MDCEAITRAVIDHHEHQIIITNNKQKPPFFSVSIFRLPDDSDLRSRSVFVHFPAITGGRVMHRRTMEEEESLESKINKTHTESLSDVGERMRR